MTGNSIVEQLKNVTENLAIVRVNEGVFKVGEINVFYMNNLQRDAIRTEVDESLKEQYGLDLKINHFVSPRTEERMREREIETGRNFRESVIIKFRIKEK